MNIANKLSVIRILLVPFFIISLISNGTNNLIAVIIFSIASFTDFLDGYLARKYNLVTVFGQFLDPLADKLLTLSAFIMLTGIGKIPAWTVCIIMAREITITGFRVIAASSGVNIAASKYGKIKTITQIFSIILLLVNFKFSLVVYYIAVIFTIISGIEYIIKNKNILDLSNI